MFGDWYQLYVKAPEGSGYTTATAMKRIDDHITRSAPAMFCGDAGLPVQGPDGIWEVRVLGAGSLEFVKYILTKHYGLEIVREVKNS